MTGIPTYSTTASENIQANTGINWDEGMSPAAVNNSARQNMADVREAWNDVAWFQYGTGSKDVPAVYASGTSFTLAGTDATAYWHAGRRVRASGASTGLIHGKVSSSAFATSTTTVNVTWDSGSLSNETLTLYASTTPVTGQPISTAGVAPYAKSIGTNGYCYMPGGLIFQWGHSLDTGTTTSISMPLTFPNNFFSAVASVDAAAAERCGVVINSTSQITVYKSSTNATYWFAIGN